MSFTVHVTDDKIAVLRFQGRSDYEESETARKEVVSFNRDLGLKKVLADWRFAYIPPEITARDFLNFGNTWNIPHADESFYMAIILSKINLDPHFGVDVSSTASRKKGIISKLFWELSDGMDWLKDI